MRPGAREFYPGAGWDPCAYCQWLHLHSEHMRFATSLPYFCLEAATAAYYQGYPPGTVRIRHTRPFSKTSLFFVPRTQPRPSHFAHAIWIRTCYGQQRHHTSEAQTILALAQVPLGYALQTTTALASVPIVPIAPCPWRLSRLCQLCSALGVPANFYRRLASWLCLTSKN